MTKDETEKLVEVANDIKWLIKAEGERKEWQTGIDSRLDSMSGRIYKNTIFRIIATAAFVIIISVIVKLYVG